MGIKKLILYSITLMITFLCVVNTFAQETEFDMIRVSISDNKFQKFTYNNITVFSTEDYKVYDKTTHKLILEIPAGEELNISLENGCFKLTSNEEESICTDTFIIESPTGFLSIKDLKRKGKQAFYSGVFEIIKCQKPEDNFYIVNFINVEEYLKGVVPNEMPVSFGLEALKAQAIAARNYVLSPRTKAYKEFDVGDSVASQVYFGANTQEELSNRAIRETKGLVAIYNWSLILAQYSSTAGGYTESFENVFSDPKSKIFPSDFKPYLVAKPDMIIQQPLNTDEAAKEFYMNSPDSYDIKSPYYRWKREWTKTELEDVLAETLLNQSKTGFIYPVFKEGDMLGNLKEFKVKKRGDSGKIIELEIITDNKIYTVKKELVIRRLLPKDNISLPSANICFEHSFDNSGNLEKIAVYGGGFGHGVGMSQYGAGFMATNLKKTFDEILKHYYIGISITTKPVILSAHPTQCKIIQQFFLPAKNADLVVNNKFNVQSINLIINDKDMTVSLNGGLNIIDISAYVKKGENNVIFSYPLSESNKKAVRLYIEMINKDAGRKYNF